MGSEIKRHIEAGRIVLRCYQAGDGPWYYAMSLRNRGHLARYEAGNAAMSINSEQAAENVVRDFAAAWTEGSAYVMGVFDKETDVFVAQVYVGLVNREVPEFAIGYFVDEAHEGRGYVTEAVTAALAFVFNDLKAHRVRSQCDDTNRRSQAVAERCGLVQEGHFLENQRNADGSLSGTLFYRLLKREFDAFN